VRVGTALAQLAGDCNTRAESLRPVVAAIGSLTGSGTIAPNGTLNFQMVVRLNSTSAAVQGVSQYASLGHPENGIQFRIAGTTANPVFVPDVVGIVGGLVNSPDAATIADGFLEGLLNKK